MTHEELRKLCKQSLRLTDDNTALDYQIDALIAAGKDDITRSCDVVFDEDNTDDCIAVVLYVKGMYPVEPDASAWSLYKERLAVIGTRKIGEVG